MNQKKCPKCGELNPPEAVMCWACYTPLTGPATAAAAGAGPLAGGKAVAAAAPEDEAKKPAATPAQMGIIGVALVVGLLYGGYAMFGGGGAQTYENFTATGGDGGNEFGNTPSQQQTGGGAPSIMPPPPVSPGFTGGAPTTDTAFSVVAAPSPNYTRGTLAIYSPNTNLSQGQARDLARTAVRTLAQNQWKPLSVYVFNDAGAAAQFKEYQAQRGNKPLAVPDYPGLSQVWSHTVMYYQYTNGREIMLNPSSNATGWWTRRA